MPFTRAVSIARLTRAGAIAWGSQPDIGLWNVTRFAETLLPLLSGDPIEAARIAEVVLSGYPEQFRSRYVARFRAKLSLPLEAPVELIQECLDLLAEQEIDFTLFFSHLTRVAGGEDPQQLVAMFSRREPFDEWLAKWRREVDPTQSLADMRAANPVLIPRNHRVDQAIQSAYGGDFVPFHRLVNALAAPYAEQPEYADLEAPPRPDEVIHQTFCGT